MDSTLIVSSGEKSAAALRETLMRENVPRIASCGSVGEARRALATSDYDLVIVNSPLPDESGIEFAQRLSEKQSGQIMLLVREEIFTETTHNLAEYGIITLSKPLQRAAFWNALMLCRATHRRFRMLQRENTKLQQKIEDIRVVDRAKLILISHLSMSEPEAHKYIERQAMDRRMTRREIADGILRTYEN
ncbi:MAG: ANTAR domain-containing protein [Oscillospiraceae bacterium]|jgi:response regulator NasT|nr:ANTAR domain-containing protein [Oscillospiraceae bacterium]